MRYPGRTAIAFGAVAMNLINIIRAIKTGEVTEEMLVAFFLAVFTLLGLYYNIPTSVAGDTGTKIMLDMKELEGTELTDVEEPEDAEVEEIDDDNRETLQ